jgi:spermidine synthase
MTPLQTNPSQPSPSHPRFLPLLLLLFLGSGCAALIYEIVWLQLLQLVIGSSAVSLGLLLGTFMGGMCLGSLALARLIPQRCHPLRVYALLESLMAVLGVTVLFAMPAIGRIYAPHAGHGFLGILWRGVVASICLLPPTFLMGATLPAISRWVESTARGMSWLGLFYGGNTAGAVLGCLLAGFYLLRKYDMAAATYVAAAINATVALSALVLANLTPHAPPREPGANSTANSRPAAEEVSPPLSVAGSRLVCLAIACSGLCALAAEVIWTRWLSLMLGTTVYAFSIILAVFLAGLGLGSMAGSLLARSRLRPVIALGCCQLLLAAAMTWAAWMLTSSLPYWPVNPELAATHPWDIFQLDLVRCLWALLPATILWGASFPLALAAVAAGGADPGRLVGKIYAANTVGAIIGALAASLLLIAWLGTQDTQRLLIALSAASGLVLLLFAFWGSAPGESATDGSSRNFVMFISLALVCGLIGYFVGSIPPVPWKLVAQGRYLATYGEDRSLVLYMGEGMNASVAVTQMENGVLNFHISGKIEASTDPQDMRLQRMLGHLPAMLHPRPRSILVVGCGAGVTAGSFLTYPEVTNITICEIEPLIPKKITPFFQKENYNVVNDPRVKIFYDDARHFVLTCPDKFDIITSDPIHPWVKGAATLYTRDYFQMCREHLNPGGIVTQWVPLYESDLRTVKSEMATFFNVFPNGTVWDNDANGAGYDTVVLGTEKPLIVNLEQLQARWQAEPAAAQSLKDVGLGSIFALLTTYGGQAADLQPWLADAQINTDRNLRLQYLAGWASDLSQAANISDSFLAYRKFPDNLFVGSDARVNTMRLILEAKSKK